MGIGRRIWTGVAVVGLVLSTVQTAGAAPQEERPAANTRPSETVTLITGDRVTVHDTDSISVEPGKGREKMTFTRSTAAGHTYVIPADARELVARGRLDRRLFDLTTLVEFGYDDAHRDTVPLIVTHADGQPAARIAGDARALPSINGVALAAAKDDAAAVWETLTDDAAAAAATRTMASGVTRVWLDGKREAVLDRSAPQINAPAAWEAGLDGSGVRVAVLDTGVDQTHPDLAGAEVAEQNFSSAPDSVDKAGHGTHVASILAGSGAKSGGKYRGIADGAEILDGKVLNDFGEGTDSWILAGMEWAAEQGADIVNLSLGGEDTPEIDPLEQAVESLTARHGILFVIAAGNEDPFNDVLASPGSAPSALTVGAVDREDQLAPFSLTGPTVGDAAVKPDLTAPGVGIVAARHAAGNLPPVSDGYTALDGTSMATPHVAGAAALIAQRHPDWSGRQLKAALVGSATPTPGLTVFQQGGGRVDVAGAMNGTVLAEPASISMGMQAWPREDDVPVNRTLTYRNHGPTDVTLALDVAEATDPTGAPTDVFSLSADEVTVAAGSTASVTVTADTNLGAADGSYSATVVASSGGGTTRTPVGITRESEHYDLTVNYTDDPAHPADFYRVSVIGLDNPTFSEAFDQDGSVTLRLPKGEYLVDHSASSADYAAQIVQPGVVLDHDQTVEVDLAAAKPYSITPPRAAELGWAELAYEVSAEGASPINGGILTNVGLDVVFTGQLGEPLPGWSMVGLVNTTWEDTAGSIYSLAWSFDRFPDGFTKAVRQRELATVRAEFGPHPAEDRGELVLGVQPKSTTMTSFAFGYATPVPGTRTVFVTTDSVRWNRRLSIPDFFAVAEFTAPLRSFRPDRTYHDRFNFPVFGPGLPAAESPWVARSADLIQARVPLFSDSGGNAGFTETESGRTRLYRDGQLVGEVPAAGLGFFPDLPAAAGDYRLTMEATRPATYDLTTSVAVEWTFRSSHVDGVAALPLTVVRFLPRLDADGTAPAGEFHLVPLRFQDETGAYGRPERITVEASYDEGTTWQRVPVAGLVAVLRHPAEASSVSLRASATDAEGNTVKQTLIRAYKLR